MKLSKSYLYIASFRDISSAQTGEKVAGILNLFGVCGPETKGVCLDGYTTFCRAPKRTSCFWFQSLADSCRGRVHSHLHRFGICLEHF